VPLLVGVFVVAAAIALVARATRLLNSLELSSVDARSHIPGSDQPHKHFVIVGLDHRSISQLAGPGGLVPRAIHANLINRLHADGARLIAVDFQFIGKSGADDTALERAVSAARAVVLATHGADSGAGADPRHPACGQFRRRASLPAVSIG
jgi:adenylate cyclase